MSRPMATVDTVTARLEAAGCVAAAEEAAEFVALAPDLDILETWIRRREEGEPPAWITGVQHFCGHAVRVDPGVYVPRVQSEELARRAVGRLADGGVRAADLCTGTGAIAVHLMAGVPRAGIVGIDRDAGAVACARRNGVRAVMGDLGRPLPDRAFDVVTAVAPYVPTAELGFLPRDVQRHEPRSALDGGADGLTVLRRVVDGAARILRVGGWLLVEVGAEQDRGLRPALAAAGFDRIATWSDDDGDLRGLEARATGAVASPQRGPGASRS